MAHVPLVKALRYLAYPCCLRSRLHMEVFGLSPTFHVSVPLLVSSSEWPACSLGPPSRKLPPSRSRATQHLCEMTLFAPFARSESYLLRPRRAQIHSLFRTHSVSRVLRSALAHVALLPAAGAVTRCHGPRLLSQGRQEQDVLWRLRQSPRADRPRSSVVCCSWFFSRRQRSTSVR